MICCTECFADLEIKATLESLNHKGSCPICGTNDTWIYDSDLDLGNSEFEELLISIIEIYKPEEELNDTVPENAKHKIEEHIQNDWNIFKVDQSGIRNIIENIISTSMDLDNRLLTQKVAVPNLYDDVYLEQNSILGKYQWEDFRKYLRNENRFHAKYINLEILAEVLKDTVSIVPKGIKLYRARIATNKNGYKAKEMGVPPNDMASAGRANSKGISCLYLANEKTTTLKEIRAGAFDFVTIATFKLKRGLIVK